MGSQLILVRHGATEFNKHSDAGGVESAERIRGWKDVPLDAEGRAEARMIADRLAHRGIHKVYTSDLSRARDTGEAIAKRAHSPIQACLELRPWNLGRLAGKKVKDVLDEITYLPEREDKKPPGGEPFRKFRMRYLSFLLDRLRESESEGSVLCLVTHTRNIQCTRAWVAAGCPPDLSIDTEVMNDYKNELGPGKDLELIPTRRGMEEVREDKGKIP